MHKRTKSAVFGLTGYVAGMFSTYLLVNATLGERRGADVFTLHEHPYQYLLDILGGLACAGIGFGLSTIGHGEPHGLADFSPRSDPAAFVDEQGAHTESPGNSPMYTPISGHRQQAHPSMPSILKVSSSSSLALASSSVGGEDVPRLTMSPDNSSGELGLGLNPSPSQSPLP